MIRDIIFEQKKKFKMRKDFASELKEKCPNLFKDFEPDFDPFTAKRMFSPIAFGVECGSGWYPIIEECAKKLEALNVEGLYATQIKEKFGGLRFYTSCCNDEINKIINEAEDACSKTCELCGQPGECDSTHGWWKTVCVECKVKKN